jgi:hypothetical protein
MQAIALHAVKNTLRTQHHGFNRIVIGQHRNHDLLPGSFGRGIGNACSFGRQSLGSVAGSVVHNNFVTGADEIARHRAAHIAKSKESNTHFVISFVLLERHGIRLRPDSRR